MHGVAGVRVGRHWTGVRVHSPRRGVAVTCHVRLRSHRGLVELRRVRRGHGGRHAGSVGVRRDERRAPAVRLRAVRIAARRGLRLERGRHRVPALVVTVPERRLGRVSGRRVVRVVRRVVGVEPASASAVVEAAPVGTGHSLVAHITSAGHGYIRTLAVVEGLVLEGVGRERLAHMTLRIVIEAAEARLAVSGLEARRRPTTAGGGLGDRRRRLSRGGDSSLSAAGDGNGRSGSGLRSAVADAGGVLEAELDRRLGVAY
jgi:hypothetical protein